MHLANILPQQALLLLAPCAWRARTLARQALPPVFLVLREDIHRWLEKQPVTIARLGDMLLQQALLLAPCAWRARTLARQAPPPVRRVLRESIHWPLARQPASIVKLENMLALPRRPRARVVRGANILRQPAQLQS